MSGKVPEERPKPRSIGTFLRRLFWRREAGPLSAEARVEVRELSDEPPPAAPGDEPRA